MKLSELRPAEGAKKARKRVGRGVGSGHGKTSCKGHKGQKARAGGKVPAWFEGGQMPLQRRLPKRGFTNIFKKKYAIVNLNCFDQFEPHSVINARLLQGKGIIRKVENDLKILGKGEINIPLVIEAQSFSRSAKKKIEDAGGKAVVI